MDNDIMETYNKIGNAIMTKIIVVFTISPVIVDYCCNSVV